MSELSIPSQKSSLWISVDGARFSRSAKLVWCRLWSSDHRPVFFLDHPDIHWYHMCHITIPRRFTNIPSKFHGNSMKKPQDSAIPTYCSRIETHIIQSQAFGGTGSALWSTTMTKQKIYDIYWLELKTWYTSYSGTVLTSNYSRTFYRPSSQHSYAKIMEQLRKVCRSSWPTDKGLKVHLQLLNLLIRLTAFLLLLL